LAFFSCKKRKILVAKKKKSCAKKKETLYQENIFLVSGNISVGVTEMQNG